MRVDYARLAYSIITPLPVLVLPFGYLLYFASVGLLYASRFAEASILVIVSTPLLALYAVWGVASAHPLGVGLYLAVAYLPAMAIMLGRVKVDVDSGVSNPSTPLMAFMLPAALIAPPFAFGYAAASGVVSRREPFSTPWFAPAAALFLTVVNYVLTGSLTPIPTPVRLFTGTPSEGFTLHFNIPAVVVAFAVGAFAAPFAYHLVAGRLHDEAARALALVASALNPIALVAYPGLLLLRDADALSVLYGSIAELPTLRQLKQYYVENWLSLIGLEEAKNELIMASYSFEGRRGIRPIHGVLLFGPAGTGKTALGLGYAAWLGLYRGFRVIIVRAGRLMRGGPWEAAWRLDRVFALARALQPSVIYIDEVDSIGRAREESGAGGYRLVSVLLQNIDGVTSRYDKVLVVATTNNVEALDEALIRPGRLGDLKIYVAKPQPETVKQIIAGIAQQRGVQIPEWLLEEASKAIETGAEAEALVNCIALKTAAGAWDQNQLKACLAGITKGIQAYPSQ